MVKQALQSSGSKEANEHQGRAWSVHELRHKSWEDLHSLWYICCKERNRLATEKRERRRLHVRSGDGEAKSREMLVCGPNIGSLLK